MGTDTTSLPESTPGMGINPEYEGVNTAQFLLNVRMLTGILFTMLHIQIYGVVNYGYELNTLIIYEVNIHGNDYTNIATMDCVTNLYNIPSLIYLLYVTDITTIMPYTSLWRHLQHYYNVTYITITSLTSL